jgi:hypothetical protein
MGNDEGTSMFRRWVNGLGKKRDPEISTLNIGGDMPAIRPRIAQKDTDSKKAPAEAPPQDGTDPTHLHKVIRFTNSRTNTTVLGHPVIFLAGYRHASIQPGSRNSQGIGGIWANDSQMSGQAEWSDDAQFGLFQRSIPEPKQILGCMGMIEGTPYQFSEILQTGENVVVYQLTNLLNGLFYPLGMGRDKVDPVYGLIHYLEKVRKGSSPYMASEVIGLCNGVLDAFPDHEIALFNKGVALLNENDIPQANACFERVIQLTPEDQLSVLHYAATLSKLGEDDHAIEMLKNADELSEEECRTALAAITSVRDSLNEMIVKVLQDAPERRDVWNLRQKYFLPRLEMDVEAQKNGLDT